MPKLDKPEHGLDGEYARDTHRGGLGDNYARDGGWSGGGKADDVVRRKRKWRRSLSPIDPFWSAVAAATAFVCDGARPPHSQSGGCGHRTPKHWPRDARSGTASAFSTSAPRTGPPPPPPRSPSRRVFRTCRWR